MLSTRDGKSHQHDVCAYPDHLSFASDALEFAFRRRDAPQLFEKHIRRERFFAVVHAVAFVCLVEHGIRDELPAAAGSHRAFVFKKRRDGTRTPADVLDDVLHRRRRFKVVALSQATISLKRPLEYARRLGKQFHFKVFIFACGEILREIQRQNATVQHCRRRRQHSALRRPPGDIEYRRVAIRSQAIRSFSAARISAMEPAHRASVLSPWHNRNMGARHNQDARSHSSGGTSKTGNRMPARRSSCSFPSFYGPDSYPADVGGRVKSRVRGRVKSRVGQKRNIVSSIQRTTVKIRTCSETRI